ncbi:uncharacterized protein CCOS01_15935 [Colletotrichum costaricense]|uniref:Uncharacterized protein n=1 Tax=Colletotrichum costaricense TaxID=1209916 RepID=A0AAI9YGK1_9PEZI|nr:uncharacterized protein CCOS01_15935 [Colletotrichum costaricense]KAK1508274.1 hypothetical protein CCOS01_15935 [Colletotrichum costaricense]
MRGRRGETTIKRYRLSQFACFKRFSCQNLHPQTSRGFTYHPGGLLQRPDPPHPARVHTCLDIGHFSLSTVRQCTGTRLPPLAVIYGHSQVSNVLVACGGTPVGGVPVLPVKHHGPVEDANRTIALVFRKTMIPHLSTPSLLWRHGRERSSIPASTEYGMPECNSFPFPNPTSLSSPCLLSGGE